MLPGLLPPDLSGAPADFVADSSREKPDGLRDQRATTTDERGSRLTKLTITVALSGEYGDIRSFIHELETSPDFLVLENVGLSQADEDSSAIDVTVQIATYFQSGVHGN